MLLFFLYYILYSSELYFQSHLVRCAFLFFFHLKSEGVLSAEDYAPFIFTMVSI
jgi:hypothetical protein